MAVAILTNFDMLTVEEKLRMVPGLLPMLTEGQSFIDAQDELSVLEFMDKYGMPRRINDEIFIAMGARAFEYMRACAVRVLMLACSPVELGARCQ